MRSNIKSPWVRGLPLLITVWGAFVRWHGLTFQRTQADDAWPVAQAIRLITQGVWPTLGEHTTFFISNPPGQAYVTLLPWLAFGSLWGVFWFITTLNVLAVPVLYRLGRELWDERVGVSAAFLFAVSPWMVHFSRWTASNSLTVASTTLVLALTLTALARRDGRRLALAFAAMTVYTQTYVLGLFLMPVQLGAVMLLRLRQLRWQAVLAGAAVFAAFTGVYLFSLTRDWNMQMGRLQAFVEDSQDGLQLRDGILYLAGIYVTGRDYVALPVMPGTLPARLAAISRWTGECVWLVLVFGVFVVLADLVRRKPEAWRGGAVLVWWVVPIALMTLATRSPSPWHALLTVPAGFLLVALGLRRLWGQRRWLGWPIGLAGLALAVFAFCQFNVDTVFNQAHPVEAVRSDSLDRLTVDAALKVGETLRRVGDQYGVRDYFANLPDPTLAAWSGRPWHTVNWYNDPSLIVAPLGRPAMYVRLGRGGALPQLPAASRAAALDLQNNDIVTVDVIPALTRQQAATLPDTRLDWPSDVGRTFLGYTWSGALEAGHTVTLTTYWLTENLPADAGNFLYGPYVHVNTPDGQTRLNVGGLPIEGYTLANGEVLFQPMVLDVPAGFAPGVYGLEIGLFDGVHENHSGATFLPPGGATPVPFYTGTITVPPG